MKNKAKEVLALIRERLYAAETYHIQSVSNLARDQEGDMMWKERNQHEMGPIDSPYKVEFSQKKVDTEKAMVDHWKAVMEYATSVFLDLLPSEWPSGLNGWMKDIRGTRLDYEKVDPKDDSRTVDMDLVEALIVDTWVAATTRNRCPGHDIKLESDYCPKCGGYRGPEEGPEEE